MQPIYTWPSSDIKTETSQLYNPISPSGIQSSTLIPVDYSYDPTPLTKSSASKRASKKSKKDEPQEKEVVPKGREAARLFRERQRARVEELEKQIAELELEQSTYRMEIDKVRLENEKIREDQRRLRYFITEAILAAYPQKPLKDISIDISKPEKVYA